MDSFQDEKRCGILNETTMTLHKQESGMPNFQTPCGHVSHVAQERLQIVEITNVANDYNTNKCRQCFEDGGEYRDYLITQLLSN